MNNVEANPVANKRSKIAMIVGVLAVIIAGIVVLWIMISKDQPFDYSMMDINDIHRQIEAHENEIHNLGTMSSALDADRYWPYDRDQTVLGMFLFREHNQRWPANLEELKESGYIQDLSHVHRNWSLLLADDEWVLAVDGFGPIAQYRN